MPLGRPKRPLFDLIAEQNADARRRAATTADAEVPASVEVKPAPQQRPASPARSTSAVTSAPASSRVQEAVRPIPRGKPQGFLGNLLSGGRAKVELTTPWVGAGIAVVLGTLLVIWIIAFKMGESEAVKRIAGNIEPSVPPTIAATPSGTSTPVPGPTSQPGTSGKTPDKNSAKTPDNKATTNPKAPAPTAPKQQQSKPTETKPTETKPAEAKVPTAPVTDGLAVPNPTEGGAVVAYNGSYDSDPRIAGNNYLVIASNMTREDARAAVDFLGANGFRALGVPYSGVDRRADGGNNSPLYKLVSTQGYDGAAMKDSQTNRDRIADEVTRLGQIYQRQHRGKYNFAKVHWEKYVR